MSLLGKYLKGWSLRTTHPTFEAGQELSAFLTGYEGGVAVARIGDTRIRVPDAPDGMVDSRVRLRVTSFDPNEHVGEAEFVEKVGDSAF
ncbi:DUF7513 family protein [Haloprofundus halobius]|uniref:DUF7513 family protein n=1 Tax=Haloprofundus halobius TaxID=2876194 RepID=UPI001CCAB1BA|nr:hypothetical protein [Haloprofundus halobius]